MSMNPKKKKMLQLAQAAREKIAEDKLAAEAAAIEAARPKDKTKKQLEEESRLAESRAFTQRALNKMDVRSDTPRLPNLAENSDSEDEDLKNRIGNVPLSWYDDEDHIGYDVYGQKIGKKDHGDSIDQFLARTDDPNFYRTVYDALNDEKVVLTDEELSIINRIRKGKFPHRAFDPYADYTAPIEVEMSALSNPQEPKARWQPSRWEAKKVLKYVHSLRNGWMRDPTVPKPPPKSVFEQTIDMWGDDGETEKDKHRRLMAPPRRPPPGHVESYNPPPEYLLTEQEQEEEAGKEKEHRRLPFTPQIHSSLRAVGAYKDLMQERFERCLDLYLCAREKRHKRGFFDTEKLIPQLPKPQDLRPFPTRLVLEFIGHTGVVRSVDASPCGQWLVSGGEDGTVRVWEASTARCVRVWAMKERVLSVAWNPNPTLPIVAAALATGVAVLHTGTGTPEQAAHAEHLLRAAPVLYKKGLTVKHALDDGYEKQGLRKSISRAARMAAAVPWVSWWRRNEEKIDLEDKPQEDGKDAAGVTTEEKEEEAAGLRVLAKQAERGLPVNATPKLVRETGRAAMLAAAAAKVQQPTTTAGPGAGAGAGDDEEEADEVDKEQAALSLEDAAEWDATAGLARLLIRVRAGVSQVCWHGRGDYLATVSPTTTHTAVLVHRLSAAATQLPFARATGLVSQISFHPTKPFFVVAAQRQVRVYSLATQRIAKTLKPPTRWISGVALHPRGEHCVVTGHDRKVSWYDMEQTAQPFKTLRYHRKGVRVAAFHKRLPLLVTAGDDGCAHILHASVPVDELDIRDPLLVPVKIINAHVPVDDMGILAATWHPTQPWLYTAAADKTIRLFS